MLDTVGDWERKYAHVTRVNQHNVLRRMLRWLWEEHGAPKLDTYVPRLTGVRPRNVTATRDEIETILNAAPPEMRLWLLLCSDLGMRSGTAVRISPHAYREDRKEFSFTTKKGAHQTLPVTAEIETILKTCDPQSTLPYVTQLRKLKTANHGRPMRNASVNVFQLRKEFATLRATLGITKRIVPHDLRRSTAVALYRQTRDLRLVQSLLGHRTMQSTIWYLDHDLEPVPIANLEAIKKPFIAWRKETKSA